MKYAFRCVNCGRLVEPEAAGDREVPTACPSCGKGVSFDPATGAKVYNPENWQVLKDLPEDELKPILEFHGIEEKHLARHKPDQPEASDREPVNHERSTSETLVQEDKPE